MLHCPCDTYKINDYVVNRYYNNMKDVFGGKDYVDVIVSPYYMTDFDSLPSKDRKAIEEYMSKVPTKKI